MISLPSIMQIFCEIRPDTPSKLPSTLPDISLESLVQVNPIEGTKLRPTIHHITCRLQKKKGKGQTIAGIGR